MNHSRCPHCNFLNFNHEENCRRCKSQLHSVANGLDHEAPSSFHAPPSPNFYQTTLPPHTSSYAPPNSSYSPPHNNYVPSANHRPQAAEISGNDSRRLLRVARGIFILLFLWGGASTVFKDKVPNIFALLLRQPSKPVVWRSYRAVTASATLQMPAEPTVSKKKRKLPLPDSAPVDYETTLYETDLGANGEAFLVFVQYPPHIRDRIRELNQEQLLEEEIKSFLQEAKADLVTKTPVMLQGYSGVEFEATARPEAKRRNEHFVGRVYLVKGQLYVQGIGGAKSSELLNHKTKFFYSLQID